MPNDATARSAVRDFFLCWNLVSFNLLLSFCCPSHPRRAAPSRIFSYGVQAMLDFFPAIFSPSSLSDSFLSLMQVHPARVDVIRWPIFFSLPLSSLYFNLHGHSSDLFLLTSGSTLGSCMPLFQPSSTPELCPEAEIMHLPNF